MFDGFDQMKQWEQAVTAFFMVIIGFGLLIVAFFVFAALAYVIAFCLALAWIVAVIGAADRGVRRY
jgi:uncharacterized membrane protein